MKTLRLVLIFCWCLSCKEISFKEPQPKGKKTLEQIPGSLQGNYLLRDDNGYMKDTLEVSAEGYRTGSMSSDEALLSDSLILKYYKGFYFLSMHKKPEWYVRVIKQEKNGDLLYMEMDHEDNNFSDFIQRLSREIKVDSISLKDKKLYQIDPSPKHLISLINKGFFKQTLLRKLQ